MFPGIDRDRSDPQAHGSRGRLSARVAGMAAGSLPLACGMIRCMPEGMRCPRCDSRTSRLERVTDQAIDASCSTCGHRWHVSGGSLTAQTRQDIQLEVLNRELKGFKP